MKQVVLIVCVLALAGCAALTPTTSVESAYVIFDVKPVLKREDLMKAVTEAVQKHNQRVSVNRNIPPANLPQTPGRFSLVDPFGGIQIQGRTPAKTAVCNDPLLNISSQANIRHGGLPEGTSFTLCLFPYKAGYHIDIYAVYEEGGGLSEAITRNLLGSSSQFIPRAMEEVRIAVERLGGRVTIVESYIPEAFQGVFSNKGGEVSNTLKK